MNKKQWLEENGFNEEENTYCIIGNTYSNKEYLKSQNCKYSPLLKWHIQEKIELPKDCKYIKIPFNKIYEWNEQLEKPLLFKDAEVWLQSALTDTAAYQFLESVGKRIYDLTVLYKSSTSFISRYGQFTYIHTFVTDKNKIIWFTTKELKYQLNQKLLLTGTIVQHQNYKGDNTTIVNRCIIRPI